ncbi:hypothetical protein KEM56_000168 [Ascosphaera pollenicola]|nr:hypothetical protein KEM56_000168 [Ascosphaera pollenicola]
MATQQATMGIIDSAARNRILELESQVAEYHRRTVMMAAQLAECQNENLELHAKLQQAQCQQNAVSRPETPSRPIDGFPGQGKSGYLSPSPPQSQRASSPSRFKSFFRSRDSQRPSNASTSSIASDPSLQEALSRETQLRKEVERMLEKTNDEIEDITVELFSRANEMVAKERRDVAKLKEKIEMLEKRDLQKGARLERLERAVTRCDRVRSLIGDRRDSAQSL